MSGFSTTLLEDCAGQLDADGRAYLDQIIAGSRRMGELIDGLLALSRAAAASCAASASMTAIMARVRENSKRTNRSGVHWQVEPDLLSRSDAGMLDAVFESAGNAWKYTARTADPVIRVQAAEAAAGFLCVCVSDNGAGFDRATPASCSAVPAPASPGRVPASASAFKPRSIAPPRRHDRRKRRARPSAPVSALSPAWSAGGLKEPES